MKLKKKTKNNPLSNIINKTLIYNHLTSVTHNYELSFSAVVKDSKSVNQVPNCLYRLQKHVHTCSKYLNIKLFTNCKQIALRCVSIHHSFILTPPPLPRCYIVWIEVLNSYWDYNSNLIGIPEDFIEFIKVKYQKSG